MTTTPVGAIIPYAGDASLTTNMMALVQAGWLPCDGSLMPVHDYPDLYAAIGTCHGGQNVGGAVVRFNLPNLHALYVRGVDGTAGRDPDKAARIPAAPGGCSGNEAGSLQGYATAAPHNAFVTDTQGAHTHNLSPVTTSDHNAYGGGAYDMAHTNGGNSTASATSDSHSHAIDGGGDAETRPVSLCVSWIIRFQPAA